MNSEKDIELSLRDKIEKVVYEYCEDIELENRCGNPNCEAYAAVALDELVDEIMAVINGGE